jgi:hypothetical protein
MGRLAAAKLLKEIAMKNFDYQEVLFRVSQSHFCDTGHYYCPRMRGDGTIQFPSGGVVRPDGSFSGPPALAERIQQELDYPLSVGSFSDAPDDCPAKEFLDNEQQRRLIEIEAN